MTKIFISGGTGFIGKQTIKLFIKEGYEVNALVRNVSLAKDIWGDSVNVFPGDILDNQSIENAMTGCDIAVHAAGYYSLGQKNRKKIAYATNVVGTKNVLSLAMKLNISHSIYISTIGIYGNTNGETFNESTPIDTSPAITAYEKTKREAHKVALKFIEEGLSLSILLPGVVFGKNDHSLFGEALNFYLKGLLPVLPSADTAITYVHVSDIAIAINKAIIAKKKGEFIVSGPNLTVKEIVELWATLTGKKPPLIYIPGKYVRPSWILMKLIGKIIPLPQFLSGEATRIAGVTYLASSEKAKNQINWDPSPLDKNILDTINYHLELNNHNRNK